MHFNDFNRFVNFETIKIIENEKIQNDGKICLWDPF